MRQEAFLIVRPQLSSSNPNFSKPRNWTANSDFWSRLTHQLLGRLKSTIPNLQIYLPKNGGFWEVGVGDWQSMQDSVFWVCGWTIAWRGLMTGIFGIMESLATQWHKDIAPTQEFFFFIVASMVYELNAVECLQLCFAFFSLVKGFILTFRLFSNSPICVYFFFFRTTKPWLNSTVFGQSSSRNKTCSWRTK